VRSLDDALALPAMIGAAAYPERGSLRRLGDAEAEPATAPTTA
jgi:hypothetical protein